MRTVNLNEVYVVIPAKDEDRYIGKLIETLLSLGFTNIVLVNDKSVDNTKSIAEKYDQVSVLDHAINLGAGAATQTGIAYAAKQQADIIVTIDADLQHNPNDLLKLIKCIEENDECDLVIGSRFMQNNEIPISRVLYNKIANLVSLVLTGKYLTDSQSGLKAITHRLASHLDLKYDGFEFCMEIIKVANQKKSQIIEVPVDVIYTEETTKKGQNLASGLRMVSRILSPFS